ncbi:hypothetical protein AB8T24_28645, partial [Klebsiella pneumoniae]
DFMDSVHHIWCPLSSQEFQDLPDGAETTLTDKIRELFEFQDDGRLSYFAVSCYDAGEADGWYQINLNIPYRAL